MQLAKFVETLQTRWPKALLLVLLNLSSTLFGTHKLPPFEIIAGCPKHLRWKGTNKKWPWYLTLSYWKDSHSDWHLVRSSHNLKQEFHFPFFLLSLLMKGKEQQHSQIWNYYHKQQNHGWQEGADYYLADSPVLQELKDASMNWCS